ncbi:cohesin domain-containing protein [Acidobacteriota bacterium]
MKKILIIPIVCLVFWSCATVSPLYKSGTLAAMDKDWDKAVELFQQAILESPNKNYLRIALVRARMNASLVHANRARLLAAEGKKEEALEEYRVSLSYDPTNIRVAEEVRSLAGQKPRELRAEVARIEPPVQLEVGKDPITLKISQTNLRSIFEALAKSAKINIIFDELFKDMPYATNMEGMNFEEALSTICLATKCFSRVINPKTVIIVPDRPDKRIQYELNVIKTFYLSNIVAQDVHSPLLQLLRSQFKAPQVFVDKALNSVTIRDIPAVIELAERILLNWDKPSAEVLIELQIMEISRSKLQKIGIELDSYSMGVQNTSGLQNESSWRQLNSLNFSGKENFQITLPTSILNFLATDTDTKMIAQSQLRGIAGQEMIYKVGDQIPVPNTTFNPIAAGGVSSQPVTSFDYKDVGIDITITPQAHLENEVTMELDIKIKGLGGTGYADLPILTTREVKNVIRLKHGESNLLAGLLKDEERKTRKGIPGLKDIPGIGALFSSTDLEIQQRDVLLIITPYILRNLDLTEADRDPIWVDLQGTSFSTSGETGAQNVREVDPEMTQRRIAQIAQQQTAGDAGPNRIQLLPANFDIAQNREFRISVNMNAGEELSTFSMTLSYDPQILEVKQVVEGGFINQLGEAPPFLKNIDNSSGMVTIGFSSPQPSKGLKGGGRVATLVFVAKGQGETHISITSSSANSTSGKAIVFTSGQARVNVK